MIKIENVDKYFNRRKKNEIHIINNTSLELEDKGLVAILGQSGSGKTTLLNVIGGLDKINKGKIYVNGKKITKRRAYTVDKIRNLNIGYIFQDYKLIEDLSVFENVAMALRMIGVKNKNEIQKRVNYVLESVNMYRYRNRPCKMLSGGEKQRVAIARAIVKNPNIVIADEPTGNLDSKNSLEIMNIIKAISKDKLVILVTHEVELATFYASRIIELKDGKVVKDYKNEEQENLDYKIENKIYLKDFKNNEKLKSKNFNIDVYSEDDENLDIKLVIKNGNIYIKSDNRKIEVVDENSAVEFIDGHYKKIDKTFYQEYEYDLNKVIDLKTKPKYSSIYGIIKSIISGVRKIADYSTLKKILLVGFFASSMFVMYAFSNIAGTTKIDDRDFISKNKNYLQVENAKVSVEEFLKYENYDNVYYMLPGNSMIKLKIKFDEYYQLTRYSLEIEGSLTAIDTISAEDIIEGRMPENEYEIVLDKMIIDNLKKENPFASSMGIRSQKDLLNKKFTVSNMNELIVVGIVDKVSPSIYANKSIFINLLNNSESEDGYFGIMYADEEQGTNEVVADYNLYLDDITLKKGKWPENDYEVMVNISNEYDMPLNKNIRVKVNNQELKVVGFYESKTNKQNYLVNANTVKYDVINKENGFVIYPKDKDLALEDFSNLNITDSYERDRKNYLREQKESIISSMIFAGVILAISLIEIYLMIRSSFLSRIKEVGVLRAIGVKKMDIYRMFLGEILAITTCSSIPGIILMAYILKGVMQIPYIGKLYIINFTTVGLSVLLVYLFNILIGLMPLYRVLRKTPAGILARHDIE